MAGTKHIKTYVNDDKLLRGVRIREREKSLRERLIAEIEAQFGARVCSPSSGAQSWSSKGAFTVRY